MSKVWQDYSDEQKLASMLSAGPYTHSCYLCGRKWDPHTGSMDFCSDCENELDLAAKNEGKDWCDVVDELDETIAYMGKELTKLDLAVRAGTYKP